MYLLGRAKGKLVMKKAVGSTSLVELSIQSNKFGVCALLSFSFSVWFHFFLGEGGAGLKKFISSILFPQIYRNGLGVCVWDLRFTDPVSYSVHHSANLLIF